MRSFTRIIIETARRAWLSSGEFRPQKLAIIEGALHPDQRPAADERDQAQRDDRAIQPDAQEMRQMEPPSWIAFKATRVTMPDDA